MKFSYDKDYSEKIRKAPTPDDAKQMAIDAKIPFLNDWHNIKEGFMIKGIYAKFSQNEDIKKLLLETGT
jgi:predicted NAD-dependent protein-ADP-ribosyltransferase YbiA (DUF1768 family)